MLCKAKELKNRLLLYQQYTKRALHTNFCLYAKAQVRSLSVDKGVVEATTNEHYGDLRMNYINNQE